MNADIDALLRDRTKYTFESLLNEQIHQEFDRIVFSGSIVEGFGNKTSDIDLYVFLPKPSNVGKFTPVGNTGFYSTTIGGRSRIDITYIDGSLWSSLNTKLDNFSEYDENREFIEPEALECLHRMTFGVVVADKVGAVEWRPSRQSLQRYIVAIMIEKANSYKQDSIGAHDAGDIETAIACERLRVRCLYDALLAANGLTNTRFEKWRIAKLRRLANQPLLAEYLFSEGIFSSEKIVTGPNYWQAIRKVSAKIEGEIL